MKAKNHSIIMALIQWRLNDLAMDESRARMEKHKQRHREAYERLREARDDFQTVPLED